MLVVLIFLNIFNILLKFLKKHVVLYNNRIAQGRICIYIHNKINAISRIWIAF